MSANEIQLKFGNYTKSDTIACVEEMRIIMEEKASEWESDTSDKDLLGKDIPRYSRFPEVPDFGALIGINYERYVPNLDTGGYYYDYLKIKKSPHADDIGSLYSEALEKCGFTYTRTEPGEFPTVWFQNSAGTSVAFGAGISDLENLMFYYVIFIIPS